MRKALLVLLLLVTAPSLAHADEPRDQPKKLPKKALSLGALTAFYAGFSTWAYFAWYHDVEHLPEFEVGGDRYFDKYTYAGGADKMGHFDVNYVLTRETTKLLKWGGWDPLPASLMAAGLSSLYFTFVEVKDGYYYEMSPGDLMADFAGAVVGAVMENSPKLDRFVDFRMEYWPSKQYRDIVAGRTTEGEVNNLNIAEDYSGQTYMLAFHAGELTKWMRYVDPIVGFRSRDYRPEPAPEAFMNRRQDLYLGLSFNAQALWDDFTGGNKVGHDVFEFANIPFTSAPVVGVSRGPNM
jgi:hypothetical protein